MKGFFSHKHPKGFTTLFAVLVSSLLLAVGMTIFQITYKEVIFATITRDSNLAFYAADSGLECALYWDLRYSGTANFESGSVFATSTDSQPPASGSAINCNMTDISTIWTYPPETPLNNPSAVAATTTFQISFPPQQSCAVVTIAKWGQPSNTSVVSRGYNICASGSPKRIERALQANY